MGARSAARKFIINIHEECVSALGLENKGKAPRLLDELSLVFLQCRFLASNKAILILCSVLWSNNLWVLCPLYEKWGAQAPCTVIQVNEKLISNEIKRM